MPALFIPSDGRATSQNILSPPLLGDEVIFIVSPGNAALGNTYQVTLNVLASFFSSFPGGNTTVITSGATLGSPYDVLTDAGRVLFNKTISSPSYAICPLAASMLYPSNLLFKDLKGDATDNPITISFTGGQLCDGLSELVIGNPYGWITIAPTPDGTAWYQLY